ncbi:hypothetical protein [Nostoc sp.]|uniref:hypothetical protein n=1 Tax=Nostoc sp. TaxID=1180 RepID=UPI002FFCB2D7
MKTGFPNITTIITLKLISTENVGFRPSTQPTLVLVFDFNPSVLEYNHNHHAKAD